MISLHSPLYAPRKCAVCNTPVADIQTGLTVHEFNCYKLHPKLVPEYHTKWFADTLRWERRSKAAFRGVETRRRKGGKRAPR